MGEIIKDILPITLFPILVCFFLYVFLITNNTIDLKISKLFRMTTIIIIVTVIVDFIKEYYSYKETYNFWTRTFATFLGFSLRPLVAYLIITISYIPIKETLGFFHNKKRVIILASIPLIINCILCFISCFTPLIYSYDKFNVFHCGPLCIVPFIVSSLYFLLMFVSLFFCYKTKNYGEKIIVCLVAFICVVSVILETVFKYYAVLNSSLSLGLLFNYLFMHTEISKIDNLTKVYNNTSFWLDVKKLNSETFSLISIDINFLKVINDKFGHSAGNDALFTTCEVIKSILPRNATLYRIGGDEFAIIYLSNNILEIKSLINGIYKTLGKNNISIACGYAIYDNVSDFENVFKEADKNMYAEKARIKSLINK